MERLPMPQTQQISHVKKGIALVDLMMVSCRLKGWSAEISEGSKLEMKALYWSLGLKGIPATVPFSLACVEEDQLIAV